MSTAIAEPEIDFSREIEVLTKPTKAPACEALPNGRHCHRTAKYSALLTPHGCPRDGRMVLLCQQCYDTIHGGSICALCSQTIIFIVRAVSL